MRQKPILSLTVALVTTWFLLCEISLWHPLLDRRLPSESITVPLSKLSDLVAGKCIPCKMMVPVLRELPEEYYGLVIIKMVKVYDEQEMTRQNRIRFIPTQIFYDVRNREVYRHGGYMNRDQVKMVLARMGVQ